jgi:hypothetical protein
MAGICAGVLIVLSVPLAGALAGPAGGLRPDGGLLGPLGLADSGARNGDAADGRSAPDRSASAAPGTGAGTGSRTGAAADPDARGGAGAGNRPPGDSAGGPPGDAGTGAARCGPELSSPEGLEAQTCVLRGEAGTWARSYYRNTSGRRLGAVLSLMGPQGRTVQIHCVVPAGDEPGVCETPKEPVGGAAEPAGSAAGVQGAGSGSGPGAWAAVAEYAVPDEGGPLLLRAGSNSGDPVDR